MRLLKHLIPPMRVKAVLVSIIIPVAASTASASASDPGQEIIGSWNFTAVLDGTNIVSMDDKQAHSLLDHEFTIRKEGAEFEKYHCGRPDFDTEHVEPNLYLKMTDLPALRG